jgi:hypothetical protein
MGTMGQDMAMINYKIQKPNNGINLGWIKKIGIGLLLNRLMEGVEGQGVNFVDLGPLEPQPTSVVYPNNAIVTGTGDYSNPFVYEGFFFQTGFKLCFFYKSGVGESLNPVYLGVDFFKRTYLTNTCNQSDCLSMTSQPSNNFFACSGTPIVINPSNLQTSFNAGTQQYSIKYTGFFYFLNACYYNPLITNSQTAGWNQLTFQSLHPSSALSCSQNNGFNCFDLNNANPPFTPSSHTFECGAPVIPTPAPISGYVWEATNSKCLFGSPTPSSNTKTLGLNIYQYESSLCNQNSCSAINDLFVADPNRIATADNFFCTGITNNVSTLRKTVTSPETYQFNGYAWVDNKCLYSNDNPTQTYVDNNDAIYKHNFLTTQSSTKGCEAMNGKPLLSPPTTNGFQSQNTFLNGICYFYNIANNQESKVCTILNENDCMKKTDNIGAISLTGVKKAQDCIKDVQWNAMTKTCTFNLNNGILHKDCSLSETQCTATALINFPTNGTPVLNPLKDPNGWCYTTEFEALKNRCYFKDKNNNLYLNCNSEYRNGAKCASNLPQNWEIPLDDINFDKLNGKNDNDCDFKITNTQWIHNICYFRAQSNKKETLMYQDCTVTSSQSCTNLINTAVELRSAAQRKFSFFTQKNDCFKTQWDTVNGICYAITNDNSISSFCDINNSLDCTFDKININEGFAVSNMDNPRVACPLILKDKIYSDANVCYMVATDGTVLKNCNYDAEDCYGMVPNYLVPLDNAIAPSVNFTIDDANECVKFSKFDNNKCYVVNNKNQTVAVESLTGQEISQTQCQTITTANPSAYKTQVMFSNGVLTSTTIASLILSSIYLWG